MKIETLAVHAGAEPDTASGAVATPITLSTTFRHGPAGEREAGFEYIRGTGNPVEQRLETAIAALEQGALAAMFASGMAAVTALFLTLPRGAHVLIPNDVYMGLRVLGADFMAPLGITVASVDTTSVERVRGAITPDTRLVWLETPSNPKLEVSDIAAVARTAHERGVLLAVDNTFATPLLQQPLALGADVVMHSATKYFGGHSDVMGGVLAFARDDELAQRVLKFRNETGSVLAPFNAWLILRGLRSMPARVAWHCRNARAVAEFLATRPEVARVNWPGSPSHANHVVARAQMRDFGGMLSIEMAGGREAAIRLASRLRLFTNATSLGGVESLVEHRASVEGAKPHSPQNLLRFSVGLEHPDDLVEDLRQALDRVGV
jgi:cystathionine gamma-synthase